MQLSIRVKLVVLLALVALLPLIAAILTITVGGRELRVDAIGRGFESVAAAQALTLQVSLCKDVEKLHLAIEESSIRTAAEVDRRLSSEELQSLDLLWAALPDDDRRIVAVLDNPASRELRRFKIEDPRFAEILVTDRYGQLVATTGRTSDFYQGDEDWWRTVVNAGGMATYIPPVAYDASSEVWSIDLCVPIMRDRKLIGVGKAVLDVSRLLIGPSVPVGELEASVMLVREDGVIIYRDKAEPLAERVGEWYGPIADWGKGGWRVTEEGMIQAYAPIRLAEEIAGHAVEMPRWSLILSLPQEQVLGGVTRLTFAVLGIGLAIIALIFVLGLFLVDRVVVRRVHRIRRASRMIAEGDLTHRIDIRSSKQVRLVGPDEIDDLAEDFNDMVNRIQKTHEELTAANELKMNFIRVAGHELRTPVSYILGMVHLLKDNQDPARLLQAIQTMGAKARRLDEIIQSMFKLMPDQRYSEDMHYSDVKVSELLEEVYLDCFPFVEQRGQRLIIEGEGKVASIRADREKFRNILENIVMNAIKFTPDEGTIEIRVGQGLGGHIAVTVQDQGPGIPESDMPHIFEPFYSGGDVMKHSSGRVGYEKRGMGLGLAIVRHFVELHGGTVSVTSTPHGSTFTVTLPMEPPHRPGRSDS